MLLGKLEYYGIRGVSLNRITSYLANIVQYAGIQQSDRAISRTVHSRSELIKRGVPQGPMLSPLLFIICINDLPNIDPMSGVLIWGHDINHDTRNTTQLIILIIIIGRKKPNAILFNKVSINCSISWNDETIGNTLYQIS